MKLKLLLSILMGFVSFGFVLNAEKKAKSVTEMNLHDFMEEYTKPATKLYDKKDNADYLNKILAKVPDMAPEDQKAEWKEIIDSKLAVGKPDETCKSCHTKFKKEYKKNYRKKLIQVPEELLPFPKEIKELLKK
ncbi:hypothetical protein EHQ96_09450 [Leptospira levettii]|uniref:Uncharacterized protein n=1 Tax=Leptospira levettii TaxID=2023178 RepID=A0A2N0AY99_9LEPT|nr:hypothetical protein [Leptospira levettii]PKA28383.1 hypothetical protein CH381_00855 [Leptospira sp. mixed culture ATI2-C-A1]MCG6147808.1 hypothetical protein [Leptospira levettii]MCW7464908.1 hypothetical protein [Leptospira levettii]MCW7473748.1 hypothetical protein [Leptospira levettii]MCW7495020.1 hypothetical protein [Leptospira levettii]